MSLPVPPRPDAGGTVPDRRADVPPKASWGPLEAFLLYLGTYVAFGQLLIAGLIVFAIGGDIAEAGANAPVLFASAVGAVSALAVTVWWLRTQHPGWRDAIGIPATVRAALRDAAWGAVAGSILYPVVVLVIGTVVATILEALSGGSIRAPDQIDPAISPGGKVLAVVYGVGIAPAVEEFFFRGLIFRGLADRYRFGIAAAVSGLAFGLVHFQQAPFPDWLLLPVVLSFAGVGFAWIYDRRGSLAAPIAAHMVFNVVGLLLIFVAPELG